MKVVVIDQTSYSFEDKNEKGRMVEGLRLSCIIESAEGYKLVELAAPYSIRDKFATLPALFEATTTVAMKKGNPVLTVADATRLGDVHLGGLFLGKAEKVA